MALVVRKFSGLADLNAFIAGRLLGSVEIPKTHSSMYLNGLTLIFNTPAAVVTFASTPAGAQVPLTFAQIKAQIETQTAAGVIASLRDGKLELRAAPAGALVLDNAGTANSKLGFDGVVDSSVAPVNPPAGAVPKYIDLVADQGSNSYLLVMEV